MDRRTLIKTGLAGTVLLGIGGVGWGVTAGERGPVDVELQRLDRRSYAILFAVAERMCRAGDGAPSASDLKVVEKIDALLASLPVAVTTELKQALLLFESPIFGAIMDGRFRPFTQCDARTQDKVLAAWRDSRLPLRRTVYDALHSLCMAPYWSDSALWGQIGYPGPPDFRRLVEESV